MNLLAIDIGNTNIGFGLYLEGEQDTVESIDGTKGDELKAILVQLWEKIPVVGLSREVKRDGVIVVSSVKPAWTEQIKQLAREELDERIRLIGRDIPLPMPTFVDDPDQVGTDRIVAAAAAHAVTEHAVVVADIGTAITIDLVDDNGVFQGGVILPGFQLAGQSLREHTAKLPEVRLKRPTEPYGKNTQDAINCGIYYAAIGALEEIIRRYAEKIGTWPQTVLTGGGAALIREDCQFVDNHVPHLVLMGIVLAYKKHLQESTELN